MIKIWYFYYFYVLDMSKLNLTSATFELLRNKCWLEPKWEKKFQTTWCAENAFTAVKQFFFSWFTISFFFLNISYLHLNMCPLFSLFFKSYHAYISFFFQNFLFVFAPSQHPSILAIILFFSGRKKICFPFMSGFFVSLFQPTVLQPFIPLISHYQTKSDALSLTRPGILILTLHILN